MSKMMSALAVRIAKKTYPTGDKNFSVMQAFPAGFTAEEADPFLMCDFFGPSISTGVETNPDAFPVQWHPHRGMDICTYLKEGVGRHADSLGNRETYATPGMQWISVGSGIEHAEGGGTPAGQNQTGFQIWINVPSFKKMADPAYGTESPESLPVIQVGDGVSATLLAGTIGDKVGPFRTVQSLQMADFTLAPNAQGTHHIPAELNNCIVYVYKGAGKVAGQDVVVHNVVRLGATDPEVREFTFSAGADGMSVMVFAGKRLDQPIAWHGPFVMCTDREIEATLQEYRRGLFPPKRVPWDYKKIATFPKK